jgi:hypothetical protein
MAEDLEWALQTHQRLVFLDGTNEDTKRANEEENPVESPNSVANYYLCPSYVIPDSECFFDYSKFTTPHRRRADLPPAGA